MLDRTIPFYNTIMKCTDYSYRETGVPEGFSITAYQPGYEKEWARLEYSIGDFDSLSEAEDYFVKTYLKEPELLPDILFALDKNNEVVGSCIAWQDKRGEEIVSSLHWLVVNEPYQRIGLGRALCIAVMNIYAEKDAFPVYIHTQPWSWKAILLYCSLGFRLQKKESFSHYVNEYEKAMTELRKVVAEDQYELLKRTSDDEVLSSEEPTETNDNDSSVSEATDYIPYEPDDSETLPFGNDKPNVPGLPEAKPQTDMSKQQPNKRGKFTKLTDVDN